MENIYSIETFDLLTSELSQSHRSVILHFIRKITTKRYKPRYNGEE
jgi:hypothetical protein